MTELRLSPREACEVKRKVIDVHAREIDRRAFEIARLQREIIATMEVEKLLEEANV